MKNMCFYQRRNSHIIWGNNDQINITHASNSTKRQEKNKFNMNNSNNINNIYNNNGNNNLKKQKQKNKLYIYFAISF